MKKQLFLTLVTGLSTVTAIAERSLWEIAPAYSSTAPTDVGSEVKNQVNQISQEQIQNQTTAISTAADKQANQVIGGLNNLPGGSYIAPLAQAQYQQQKQQGIAYLTQKAMAGIADFMQGSGLSNILGGLGGSVTRLLGGWLGGGNSAETASTNAVNSTAQIYQQGVEDAATQIAKVTDDRLNATEQLLRARIQAGGSGTTINDAATYANAVQQVASYAHAPNPTSGDDSTKAAIVAVSSTAIAQAANGATGQMALNGQMANTAVNVAGMLSDAQNSPDNSLDQLNTISQQLAKQGEINGNATQIAGETRTLIAAQLAQQGSDAEARVRQEREQAAEAKYLETQSGHSLGLIQRLGFGQTAKSVQP